jgi:4-hydroxy-tetrahydrodipicolinate synthase
MTTPLAPGVWGILATPFTDDLAFDPDSMARQVELFEGLPAAGVVALGVFGEATSLDSTEQGQVIDAVLAATSSLPVVVGVSARSTAPAVEQSRLAAEHAGDQFAGVMVQVNSPRPDALIEHLTAIHDATGAGVVIQDYPLVSGVKISPDDLVRTVEACPFVVAIKAEAPPTSVAISRTAGRVDVPVFGGLGGVGLLDELAAGAAGAMTGFSRPEALLEAITTRHTDGPAAAERAYSRWLPIANFEAQVGIGLAIRKEAFRRRGIFSSGAVRPPAPAMPAELHPLLDAHIEAVSTAV